MQRYNSKLYPGIISRIYRRILWVVEWLGNWLIDGIQFHFANLSNSKIKKYKEHKKNLVVIANGPSISNCMDEIMSHEDCDYACMNYFPLKSEYFDKIKPRFMFATDVMFFDKEYPNPVRRKDTVLLRQKLESVDWEMIVFVKQGCSLELKNNHIKEIKVCMTQIGGVYSRFRGWLFDKGMASPITATVAATAILNGIKMGYQSIYAYGIDQSSHENIKVDNNNRTIRNVPHFYKETNIKEDTALNYDIGAILWDSYRSIIGYRMLEKYAVARGCKIYNCTQGSYVDAFDRYELLKII